LINSNKGKVNKIRYLSNEIDKECGITFKPKLNERSLKKVNSSMQERSKSFIDLKQEKLRNSMIIQEKECTFSPKINNNNHYSINNKIINNNNDNKKFNFIKSLRNDENTGNRLYQYNKAYSMKKEILSEKHKEIHSFKPKISKNTKNILQDKENYHKIFSNQQERENERETKNQEIIKEALLLRENNMKIKQDLVNILYESCNYNSNEFGKDEYSLYGDRLIMKDTFMEGNYNDYNFNKRKSSSSIEDFGESRHQNEYNFFFSN